MSASTDTSSPISKLRQLWERKHWLIVISALLLAVIVIVGSVLLLTSPPQKEVFDGLPHSYTYMEITTPQKVQLHMMSLNPDDILLKTAGTPLRQVAAYGINGGFFYGKDLLSISIMNDNPVNGAKKAYGSGWFNAKYTRGTLVWDATSRKFSVQVVSSGDELIVADRNHYFAQGGISMNLGHEELWEATATLEHLPYADERRMRSGMVYDNADKLWLIVTPTLCTAAEFRTAVLQNVPGEDREGIYLDGDGSSQMNAAEVVLTGDERSVVQMIAVAIH
ncbi:hypothetical protein [Paenibacillus monticola]|uniref:Phosphodiester glycosidase domain-containing protein n=1 Tax=Paenibacillus monticola TaxID=2666075 RepID=A0A7X2H3I5_9BACL|nr:hypothetical protein [Paenibacillus monticola]MRN52811.1 hypothetical protein [Paenibacillus monticola]